MRARIIEMRQERAGLWEQAKALNEEAMKEKRDFTALETEQYDKLMAKMDSLRATIDRNERLLNEETALNSSTRTGEGVTPNAGADNASPRASKEYRAAFERFLTQGLSSLSANEVKAMASDPDTAGGFLVTPQEMADELLKNVDDTVMIRQFARQFRLKTAKSLGVPTLENDFDDAEWTTELRTGGEDDLTFGKRELRPHPVAKRAKISNTLLRQTANGAEAIVRERLAYKFGVTLEKSYMTGDGNAKPLGIFTASANGITTARDVATDNTATAITSDGLINALMSLKEAHQAKARWIFHRDAIAKIRKLKDLNGQYMWQPGITGGAPDRIFEKPYSMSEFAPNTFTTGQYVGIIGNFDYYWYVDALDLQIQRLVELYAETNQTGFIGRYEGDGMPVLAEAFARVKLG